MKASDSNRKQQKAASSARRARQSGPPARLRRGEKAQEPRARLHDLQDDDPTIRLQAAIQFATSATHLSRIIPILLGIVRDIDRPWNVEDAVLALGHLGASCLQTKQPVLNVLSEAYRNALADERPSLRPAIKFAVARIDHTYQLDLAISSDLKATHGRVAAVEKDLPPDIALAQLDALQRRLDEVHRPIVAAFQNLLDSLAGQSFDSKDINSAVAIQIQTVCSRLRKRIGSVEGLPCTLRWKEAGGAKFGVFELRAQIDGRAKTVYGATQLPPRLKLVDPPPDLRKASKA